MLRARAPGGHLPQKSLRPRSLVIRVYRQGRGDVIGTVEDAMGRCKRYFAGTQELLAAIEGVLGARLQMDNRDEKETRRRKP